MRLTPKKSEYQRSCLAVDLNTHYKINHRSESNKYLDVRTDDKIIEPYENPILDRVQFSF